MIPFRVFTGVVALCVCALPFSGLCAADDSLPRQARAAMEKATVYMRSISTEGGYLWRYSPDLKERAGEDRATPTQIWLQPPGTPAMGMAFLRAYQATGDEGHLEAAKAAADALAIGQLESGGWDKLVEFDPKQSERWYRRSDVGKISAAEAAKRRNYTTFDDDKTQSGLRLLLAVADASKGSNEPRDIRIREARDYGLAKLIEAQRPNGGFPHGWHGKAVSATEYPVQPARFPADYPREYPAKGASHFYTFNDDGQRDCVATLLDAAKRLGRPEYLAAALKGGEFIIQAQLPDPQPIWAMQYNEQMEPAWARRFEPPCVCSRESSGAMRLLVDLYLETGDEKFLEPLPRAIAWFQRNELAPGVWARMYELHTNKPIFGDRDGKIKYRVEDLSLERQTGYSWRGSYGLPDTIAYYKKVKAVGREAMLAKRKATEEKEQSARYRASRAKDLEPSVRAAIVALDEQGRWIDREQGREQIRTRTFIRNMELLAEYVEHAEAAKS